MLRLRALDTQSPVESSGRTQSEGFEAVIGEFGSGIPNDNTMHLLSFCASSSLAVTVPGSSALTFTAGPGIQMIVIRVRK